MKIGKNLKMLRIAAGMTQEELSKKVKLSKSNISKYESDDMEPNLTTLDMFAKIFNVSVEYLLTGKENVPIQADFREIVGSKAAMKTIPKPEPDIKWGDFGISFYEGNDKKLTQKQKDDILKFVKFTLMEDEEQDKNKK